MEQHLGARALSSTKVRDLRSLRVAFIRHNGPYDEVDITMWRSLMACAKRRGIPGGALLGVAHDAPSFVDARHLRFDACLVVPDDTSEPRAGSRIAMTDLRGGPHGLTTYVGPSSQIKGAYSAIMQRLLARKNLSVIGLPAIERYEATQILGGELQQIEIAVPVERKPGRSQALAACRGHATQPRRKGRF
jgi:AraC family transcriptional regulator